MGWPFYLFGNLFRACSLKCGSTVSVKSSAPSSTTHHADKGTLSTSICAFPLDVSTGLISPLLPLKASQTEHSGRQVTVIANISGQQDRAFEAIDAAGTSKAVAEHKQG